MRPAHRAKVVAALAGLAVGTASIETFAQEQPEPSATSSIQHEQGGPNVERATATTPPSAAPDSKDTSPKGRLSFSKDQVRLSFAVVLLLAFLFLLLFWWQQMSERSSYFAKIFKSTIQDSEFRRLTAPIETQWEQGDYLNELHFESSDRAQEWLKGNNKPEPDPDLLQVAAKVGRMSLVMSHSDELRLMLARQMGLSWASGSGLIQSGATQNPFHWSGQTSLPGAPWTESDQAKAAEWAALNREFEEKLDLFRGRQHLWAVRAAARLEKWYQEDRDEQRKKASEQSDLALKIDFSALRGRGPEFLLEFTALVVIILSAVVLGILSVLNSEQIGTLLAAIAGYVLGRATTRSRTSESEPAGPAAENGNNAPPAPTRGRPP